MYTGVEGRVLALRELFLDTDVICQSSVSLKGCMSPKALLKASPLVSHVQAIWKNHSKTKCLVKICDSFVKIDSQFFLVFFVSAKELRDNELIKTSHRSSAESKINHWKSHF